MDFLTQLFDVFKKLSFASKSALVSFISGSLGVGLGAVIGTFAIPGLGTLAGALIGGGIGFGVPIISSFVAWCWFGDGINRYFAKPFIPSNHLEYFPDNDAESSSEDNSPENRVNGTDKKVSSVGSGSAVKSKGTDNLNFLQKHRCENLNPYSQVDPETMKCKIQ